MCIAVPRIVSLDENKYVLIPRRMEKDIRDRTLTRNENQKEVLS